MCDFDDFFTVLVQGPGDDHPISYAADSRLDAIIQCADNHLRSWVTGHSTHTTPAIWVVNAEGVTVYETWEERRRIKHKDGTTFVETPVQFWQGELWWYRNGRHDGVSIEAVPMARQESLRHRDAPLPLNYPLFEYPAQYGCELIEPLVNPYMLRV